MTSERKELQFDEDMTAEEFQLINTLLKKVPAPESDASDKSTWVARRREQFDLSGQYGDAQ